MQKRTHPTGQHRAQAQPGASLLGGDRAQVATARAQARAHETAASPASRARTLAVRRCGLPIGLDNCPVCGRITAYPAQFVADRVCERCVDERRPEAVRIVDAFSGRAG